MNNRLHQTLKSSPWRFMKVRERLMHHTDHQRKGVVSLPPPVLVLFSILSVQLGAALAKSLFPAIGSGGTVFLRVGLAALVLLLVWRPHLRAYTREHYALVALFGVTLALLRLLASATRVIGWMLAAATVAAVVYPVVAALSRWVPRAIAIVIVALLAFAAIGTVAYGIVDELVRETHALQAVAPDVGRNLEESKRFGELARKVELTERVTRFAKAVPERLRGGDTATALRSAATRGVAFLVTGVLTLFLLVHGPLAETVIQLLAQLAERRP